MVFYEVDTPDHMGTKTFVMQGGSPDEYWKRYGKTPYLFSSAGGVYSELK